MFFINDDMSGDFPLIARDFYAHEFANLSRILCIAKMSDIRINPDCNFIYGFLNELSDQLDSHERFSFMKATGETGTNTFFMAFGGDSVKVEQIENSQSASLLTHKDAAGSHWFRQDFYLGICHRAATEAHAGNLYIAV